MLTKVCIVCGKEFAKPETCSLVDWFGGKRRPNGRRFCSVKCADKDKIGKDTWNKGIKTGIVPKTAFKKGQRTSPKTEFKKGQIPFNKGKSGNEYLSIEARGKMSYWGDKHGKETPNWRGGTTKLRTAIMSLQKYRDWRTSVFERDGYACQGCGTKGKIECHHKKGIRKILKENNIKTTEQAKKCEELWRVSNGQTLCIPCHRQTDSYLVVTSKITA